MVEFSLNTNYNNDYFQNKTPYEITVLKEQINAANYLNTNYLRIPISYKIKSSEFTNLQLFSIQGYIFYGKEDVSTRMGGWDINRIALSAPINLSEIECDSQISLAFELTNEKIEHLEKLRNGNNLLLSLGLRLIVYTKDNIYKGFGHIKASTTFQIARSDWEDNLIQKWNYINYHLVMWNAPKSLNKKLSKAQEEYKKAENCFFSSDWENTLVKLRSCHERILTLRKLDLKNKNAHFETLVDAFASQVLKQRIGKTRSDMIANLLRSQRNTLSSVTKAGHRNVSREDAAFLLRITGSILSYISESFESKL